MRRKIATLLGTLMVVGVMTLSIPVASAQTGYPPGPCTAGDTFIDAGTHAVGETFTIRLATICLWQPGAGIATTVNGQFVGTKTADASSAVFVNVTVLSPTQLSIDDPVLVSAQCGQNTAVGVGPTAEGQTETATAVFNINCGAGTAARAGSVPGGVAFTGANILKWGGIALVLLVGGWFLVGIARRRRTDPSS